MTEGLDLHLGVDRSPPNVAGMTVAKSSNTVLTMLQRRDRRAVRA